MVHMPQKRALCQHQGRGASPLCEASGKEKEVSQPFPPLLYLSQFFSGHLDLQIQLFIFSVCWGVHGIGVSKGFIASQQALNILIYSPNCNHSFFMMAVSCLQCLLCTWVT